MALTKNEMIRKMAEHRHRGPDAYGNYPYLEQDAMRYWVIRDMMNASNTDELIDAKIDEIMSQ